jgi:hypothetical protein
VVKGDHHLISLWNPERFYLDLDNYEAEIRSRFDAKLWHKGRR